MPYSHSPCMWGHMLWRVLGNAVPTLGSLIPFGENAKVVGTGEQRMISRFPEVSWSPHDWECVLHGGSPLLSRRRVWKDWWSESSTVIGNWWRCRVPGPHPAKSELAFHWITVKGTQMCGKKPTPADQATSQAGSSTVAGITHNNRECSHVPRRQEDKG